MPKLDARYDAIAAASAVGRLDILSLILAFGAVVAGLGLIYSYSVFRTAAIEAAVSEMNANLPSFLSRHLAEHGEALIVGALKDAELVAAINRRFTELGIDDTDDAAQVDSEAGWAGDEGEEVSCPKLNTRSEPSEPTSRSKWRLSYEALAFIWKQKQS